MEMLDARDLVENRHCRNRRNSTFNTLNTSLKRAVPAIVIVLPLRVPGFALAIPRHLQTANKEVA